MSDIAPLLLVLLCWFFFGSRISKFRKAGKGAAAGTGLPKSGAPKAESANPVSPSSSAPVSESPVRSPVMPSVSSPVQGAPVRSPMTPSVSAPAFSEGTSGWERDNPSGSLGEDTLEGIDPCHEDQSREMDLLRTGSGQSAPGSAQGLTLSWAGNDVVRGFVYGEILNQKKSRL